MMKKVLWLIVAMLMAMALAGCAPAGTEPETPPEQENEEVTEPEELVFIEAEGRLNGWIDGNSVEIESDGVPMAFRTEKMAAGQMESIEDGSEVVFIYYVNESGQQMLTEIRKK